MEAKKETKPVVFSVSGNRITPGDEFIRPAEIAPGASLRSQNWHFFGHDNLFPQALAYLNRKSPVHRGIINSRRRYITGSGFTTEDATLENYLTTVNAQNETLRHIYGRLVLDKVSSGNAYIEIVTNRQRQFINIYHHDYTNCRVGRKNEEGYILLHPNWAKAPLEKSKIKRIPKYPEFEDTEGDGNLRSILSITDYEPEFKIYGIPDWIAGIGVSAIAYKTDKWNISRLDNSFNSSGVFVVDGDFNSDAEAEELKEEVKKQYTGEGNTGKIVFIAKNLGGGSTSFTPIQTNNEGDWSDLHRQSGEDLIIAHGWFRALTGYVDNSGFDTDRILNEWEIAVNTVIPEFQNSILDPLKKVLQDVGGMDASTLSVVNKPPIRKKPGYMFIWEARKADGLDYDPEDEKQQGYVANISAKAQNNPNPNNRNNAQ